MKLPIGPARARIPLLALVGTLAALAACDRGGGLRVNDKPAITPHESPVTAAAVAPTPSAPAVTLPDFASLADKVVPSVVKIEVEQHISMGNRARMRGQPRSLEPDDFFRFFGGGAPPPKEFENRGLGSGFVIDGKGVILTNAHVIEKADTISVMLALADGSEKRLKAKLLGEAPEYDVALIQTEEDAKAQPIALGDSDKTRIGEWVMAVGNPFGLEHSVSVGIISAKERRDVMPSGRQGLYNFLQTDASINPGNSGGPLINTRGEVIGINSAINAQGQGIGFAIPINMVKQMLPQLQKGGHFVRSWLGIKIQPLTEELAQSYGLPDAQGVLVAEVVKGGPAASAGLREGDVILEFDGNKLHRSTDLSLYASMAGVGRAVPLTLWRDKTKKSLKVKLEAFPEDQAQLAGDSGSPENEGGRVGLGLADLTPGARQELGLEASRGALVESVEPGSPAAKAGLESGDLIISIDGDEVAGARDAAQKLKVAKSGEVLRLRIERRQQRLYMALRKP